MNSSNAMNTTEPKALAADNVHETAIALLDVPKDAAIADMPCGEGALTSRLLRLGYTDVRAGDINTAQVKIADPRVTAVTVDLSKPLALPDASLDAFLCIECIEHLENPYQLVRELARVIKPGGTLVLSTPNVLSTNARLKYLSAGYFPHFTELAFRWSTLRELGFQGHIMPVPLTMVYYLALINGFAIEAVRTNHFKRTPNMRDRFVAKAVKVVSRRFLPSDAYEVMTSDTVLFGDVLIIRMRRLAEARP